MRRLERFRQERRECFSIFVKTVPGVLPEIRLSQDLRDCVARADGGGIVSEFGECGIRPLQCLIFRHSSPW